MIALITTLLLAAPAAPPSSGPVLPATACVAVDDASGRVAVLTDGRVEIRSSFDAPADRAVPLGDLRQPVLELYRGGVLIIGHGAGEYIDLVAMNDRGAVLRRWPAMSIFSHRGLSYDGTSLIAVTPMSSEIQERFGAPPTLPLHSPVVVMERLDGASRWSLALSPDPGSGQPPAKAQSALALAADDVVIAYEYAIMRSKDHRALWIRDRLPADAWQLMDVGQGLVVAIGPRSGRLVVLRLEDGMNIGGWEPQRGSARAQAMMAQRHGVQRTAGWRKEAEADAETTPGWKHAPVREKAASMLFGASAARILPNGAVAVVGGCASYRFPQWLAVLDPGAGELVTDDLLTGLMPAGETTADDGRPGRALHPQDVAPLPDGTLLVRTDNGWFRLQPR